jgi:hypothetical protein
MVRVAVGVIELSTGAGKRANMQAEAGLPDALSRL